MRFNTEYGLASDFTDLWDRLQIEEACCGAAGEQDFMLYLNRSIPSSCCAPNDSVVVTRRHPYTSPVIFRTTGNSSSGGGADGLGSDLVGEAAVAKLDKFNKTIDEATHLGWNHILSIATTSNNKPPQQHPPQSPHDANKNGSPTSPATSCEKRHSAGCVGKLANWLESSATILFVLGYCVIAFLKLCFLGILRYEIREMIQKIKLLQTEMASTLCSDTEPVNTTVSGVTFGSHKYCRYSCRWTFRGGK